MTAAPVGIVGRSPALARAVALAERFAPTPLPILLVGATGTGKELFAQHIHQLSGRRGRFVPVNCAALPRDMVESLLFGHRRGAFTGAVDGAMGFIEAADRGTLFLDELSSLPCEAQLKLLRVLEVKEVTRLGDTQARPVDFRVVAAAQEQLRTRLETAAFRLDLYERVAGVVIGLPSLRERREDLVPLAEYFAGRGGRTLEPDAIPVLHAYPWPGNVRELRAAIERAGFLSENGTVGKEALEDAVALGGPDIAGAGTPESPRRDRAAHPGERARLIATCRDHGWEARRVATALGISRATLFRRLRVLGLSMRACARPT